MAWLRQTCLQRPVMLDRSRAESGIAGSAKGAR
jgi:hypothetical protein